MQIPAVTKIDRRLHLGSLVFGAGWGIAGICPGPAVVLAGTGSIDALVFLTAMLLARVFTRNCKGVDERLAVSRR